jgi:hypothetical protein
MHVAYPDLMTYELGPAPREISEDQLVEDGPRVRALIVQRLELVWARCEQRIRDDMNGTRPIDPRFLEIALRAEKDLALHYRLSRVPAPVEEEDDPALQAVDRGALVLDFLEGVEARIRQGQAAAAAWGAGKQSEPAAGTSTEELGQDGSAA